tara:strand:+ start:122 stop:520 length:399 start_codon:yes stop_codon:yes gene_type:complete
MNKKGFQLRSGNRPSFYKMSGASPFKEDDNNTNNDAGNADNDAGNASDNGEEEKKDTPDPDKPLAKVGKVLFNSIAGGLNAIQKNKIKKLKINFGHNEAKRQKEADAKDPGSSVVDDILNEEGTFKEENKND